MIRSSFLVLVAFCAASASAGVVIPPGLEPGQVERQLRQLHVPENPPEPSLPPAPQQLVPPQAADTTFTLRHVRVDGATVYSEADLASFTAALVGRQVTVAQVFQIANAMTARYRRDGYILSQVLVPAQDIADGDVRLVAVEGFVDEVTIRGNAPGDDRRLAAYSERVKRARPLTAAALERCLLLMNDLGGSHARGTLVPSSRTPGAAELVVDFQRERVQFALTSDNRNSRSLGPYRGGIDAEGYGLLGDWDQLAFRGGSSFDSEFNFLSLNYGTPLGSRGLRWTAGVTGVRARPGRAANLTATDLKTDSISGLLQLEYPLLRSRSTNLSARVALTSFDGQSEFSLANVSDDRIRAARVGFTFDHTDALRGISTIDIELARGFNGLGARTEGSDDTPLSRANGRTDFSKVSLYAARLQGFGNHWSALLALSAQQAFNPLLASELFAFGGDQFGRGYDAAELVGDSGEAAKFELRYDGAVPQMGVAAYTMYGFFDAGRVRRRDPINEAGEEHASSAGLGIRLTSTAHRWQGLLEAALPLDRDVASEGNRHVRILFGFQVNL
jgi:hemolysin activation/secretion protein